MDEINKREEIKQLMEARILDSTNSLNTAIITVDSLKNENDKLNNNINQQIIIINKLEKDNIYNDNKFTEESNKYSEKIDKLKIESKNDVAQNMKEIDNLKEEIKFKVNKYNELEIENNNIISA